MRIVFDKDFYKMLKKIDVRIRKSFKANILIFSKNPYDPRLNNHALKREWKGYKSINIIADWRALYKEVQEEDEVVAYFIALDTHKELYARGN